MGRDDKGRGMTCDHDYRQIGRVLGDTFTTTVYRCDLCQDKTEHRKRWFGDDWQPTSERARERGYDPADYRDAPDDYDDAA
jgi:hypothetical protein